MIRKFIKSTISKRKKLLIHLLIFLFKIRLLPKEFHKRALVELNIKKHKKYFNNLKLTYNNQGFYFVDPMPDENYLKTIVRNLTGNAISVLKNTEHPHILWKAWKEHTVSYLSITDNGPGATETQFKALYDDTHAVGIKTGLGLHLIRDLAKAIDCKLVVNSELGKGTVITVIFK